MLMYISRWFTRSERSRANTFLILGNPVTVLWMSVVSGYLVRSFGWREMFVFEGIPALIWAVVWWFTVQDRPAEVTWMSDAEKIEFGARLKAEQANIAPMRDYKAAFRSSIVWKCCAIHALWSIGVYGFIMWLPSILKAASTIDIVSVGWLAAVPYLAAIILMLLASWLSDKTRNRKLFVWPLLLVGTIAFVASYLVGGSHFWISFALLVVAGANTGTDSGQCAGRCDRPGQRVRSAGCVHWLVYRWLPERRDRQSRSLVYLHGGRPASLGHPDDYRACAFRPAREA